MKVPLGFTFMHHLHLIFFSKIIQEEHWRRTYRKYMKNNIFMFYDFIWMDWLKCLEHFDVSFWTILQSVLVIC